MKLITFVSLLLGCTHLHADPATVQTLLLPTAQRSLVWTPGQKLISLTAAEAAPIELELFAAPQDFWLATVPTAEIYGLFSDGKNAARLHWDATEQILVMDEWLTAPEGQTFTTSSAAGGYWPPSSVLTRTLIAKAMTGKSTARTTQQLGEVTNYLYFPGATAIPISPTAANVFFFPVDPFASPAAIMSHASRHGAWTTVGSSANTVIPHSDGGATAGLTAQPPVTVSLPSATSVRLTNQLTPSITFITARAVAAIPAAPEPLIVISPPGGTYSTPPLTADPRNLVIGAPQVRVMPVRILLPHAFPTNQITYQFSSQTSQQSYTSQPIYAADGETLTVYNFLIPVATATYNFAAPTPATASTSLDSNNNGLPDAWELLFNITNPLADADGDGTSNLAEFLAGTDPKDPLSAPNLPLLPPLSIATNAITRQVQLTWPSRLGPMSLESSSDLHHWTSNRIEAGTTSKSEPTVTRQFYRLGLLPSVQE